MTFGPITTALYLAVGLGAMIAFLACATDADCRKFIASSWYTITGDRNLPTAIVTLTFFVLLLWPAVAAVWVMDRIAGRKS